MNRYRRAKQFLVFLALSSVSMGASAGTMGPTSRGTISISITIPPHVVVRLASDVASGGSAAANGLCVASNGFSQYHVALIDLQGSIAKIATPSQIQLIDAGASRPALCTSDSGASRVIGPPGQGPSLPTSGSGEEPPTLLIVPD